MSATAAFDARPGEAGAGPLLEVSGLAVEFAGPAGWQRVTEDVSFRVEAGETLGLVGESGCGKTVTSLSILGLLPRGQGRVGAGEIRFDGRDLAALAPDELRGIRGDDIAMIFQEPMTSLNPAFTVGNQVAEAVRAHRSTTRREARARAVELLDRVGIPHAVQRVGDYPHQFSGGMRQRAMIAMALSCEPRLLVADEPTTALDVTIQAQILDLLRDLQRDLGMAVIFVTHDLGVVAETCDRVVVMYAGQVVEQAPVDDLFERPAHPYTEGLLRAMPQHSPDGGRLHVIPGVVPQPDRMPEGCRFAPRCGYAQARCTEAPVPLEARDAGSVRCVRHAELELEGVE